MAHGDEADVDGTVVAFVVKGVSSGSLRIGDSEGTATAWMAGNHDTVDASQHAYWTGAQDANGLLDAFTVVAKDNSGSLSNRAVQAVVNVTAVNDLPTTTNSSVTTNEDTAVALRDFGLYADRENTALAKVQITELPSAGQLRYSSDGGDWSPVTTGQEISAEDILAGRLRFEPALNANGSTYTTVGYKVSDGADYSANAYTLTLNVTAVNDAPTFTVIAGVVATTLEATPVEVTLLDIKAQGDEADVDGTVDAFVVKGLSSGTLRIGLDASSATAWDAAANNIIDTTHHAYWAQEAALVGILDAFTVVARDNSGVESTTAIQATMNVAALNPPNSHPPVFTSASIGSVDENAARMIIMSTIIYTATATDADNLLSLIYSVSDTDPTLVTIDAITGVVTLFGTADYETKSSYRFTVTAHDGDPSHDTPLAVVVSVVNLDEVAPTITSGGTATSIAENSGAGQVIYTVTSTDTVDTSAGVTYSLKTGGDASLLTIDTGTGAVKLTANPNYETHASYNFTVLASDGVNAATEQAVTLSIRNLDEVAPTITSGATATTIAENSGAGQVIYTVTSTDTVDTSAGVTYSLKAGGDASLLTIDAGTGAVKLTANPNYETKASYNFTVLASDGVNAATEQAVTLSIRNLDESAPTITSGATATTIAENSGAGQVIYTVTSTDTVDTSAGVTYSLKTGGDASLLTIDTGTGAVKLTANPNYETKASYNFTVLASDGVNAATEQVVAATVNNLNDNAPVFTSGSTASVVENAPTSTVVYAAAAVDADNLVPLTYSLGGTDVTLLKIGASTGTVMLNSSANYESRSSYSFTVTAHDGDAAHDTTQDVAVSVVNLNDPPTSSAHTITIDEDLAKLLSLTDFGTYADQDGTALAKVQITTLESAGVLQYHDGTWKDVTLNQEITATDINEGKLRFEPVANANGSAYATLGFKVSDGLLYSVNAYTLTVNVTAVNDAPTLTDFAGSGNEDATITFAETDFTSHFADVDGDSLSAIKVTSLPGHGTLKLPGADVALNQVITAADLANLTFVPTAHWHGSDSFGWQVSDGTAYSAAAATVNLTVVDNVAPTITTMNPADNAIAVPVDSNIVLTFSEAVKAGTGTIAIHSLSATGTVVESYDAATSAKLTIEGNTLTINPTANLANSSHYFVTFDAGTIRDTAGNSFAGTTSYDFTTANMLYDLIGSAKFWKTGAPIATVTSTLTTSVSSAHPIEFRNIQTAADGSRTIEIWENSVRTDISDFGFDLKLPTGSVPTWQSATTLPAGWTLLPTTTEPGVFMLGGLGSGITPLSAVPVKLGTLTLSAPTNPSHFDLTLTMGYVGGTSISPFGIVSDESITGRDGLYQHLDLVSDTYMLQTTKPIDSTIRGIAVTSGDALAALKIALLINPNSDGSPVSPYQYLAADVNKDGRVTSGDALNILKMAIKYPGAPTNEWLFVEPSVGTETMSRTSVHWPVADLSIPLDHNMELDLIGIVKGDINGSWVG